MNRMHRRTWGPGCGAVRVPPKDGLSERQSTVMRRSIWSWNPISMPALAFRLQAPVAASPYTHHLSTYEHVPLDRNEHHREGADANASRSGNLLRSEVCVKTRILQPGCLHNSLGECQNAARPIIEILLKTNAQNRAK